MQKQQQFNFASALTGFAVGALVAGLAVIQFVPGESNGNGGGLVPLAVGPGGGVGNVGAGDVALQEGEQLAVSDTGELVVVDDSGNVVRSASESVGGSTGGQAGSAGSAGGRTGSGVNVGGTGGAGSASGSGGGDGGGNGGGGAACEGQGGATDVGVSAGEIKLGATVAESGIAQSFLGEVRQAMEAVKNKVNRSSGICGRQLKVIYKDDGWDANRGATFIQNLVEGEKVFALSVSPSSEGLNQASNQGYFKAQGVPVIGADGLNVTQFKDPMIFPVAAATITTVDVMMKNAWDRGARNPAIVFGNTYRFGVEGAFAFNAAFKKLSGKDIPGYKNPLAAGGGGCSERFCGVSAAQGQYGTQVSTINTGCGKAPACDFMLLLLEPKTAQDWMSVPGVKQPKDFTPAGMAGPQPLFTYSFGRNCGDKCGGMWMWTGYNPPIEQYASSAAVKAFVNDLKAQNASADEYNQFTMGGYVGMNVLVQALKQVGANLTRERLLEVMNSMAPISTGLTTTPLKWTATARHANKSAQAFEVQSKNGFTGWRFKQAPILDPWLGQHAG